MVKVSQKRMKTNVFAWHHADFGILFFLQRMMRKKRQVFALKYCTLLGELLLHSLLQFPKGKKILSKLLKQTTLVYLSGPWIKSTDI